MEYHGFDPTLSAYPPYPAFPYLPCPPGVPPPSFYHHLLAHSQGHPTPGVTDPLHHNLHNPAVTGSHPVFHPTGHPNPYQQHPFRPVAMPAAQGFSPAPGQLPLLYNHQDHKYPSFPGPPSKALVSQPNTPQSAPPKPTLSTAGASAASLGNNSPSTPVAVVKTPSAKSKKKTAGSENSKKRREFSELAKARTEKLMNDGPAYHQPSPASTDSNLHQYQLGSQQQMSAVSDNTMNEATARRNLMEDILNNKKLQLMKSPAVILALRIKQKNVEDQKRES